MIEQQIEIFSRSLTNLASEYSDPSVILQHIPVLKNNLMFQQNPEYLLYGFGGIIAFLFVLRTVRKRMKKRVKNIAMVMPQPYLGDADHSHTDETAPASFVKDEFSDQSDLASSPEQPAPQAPPEAPPEAPMRSAAQNLEDVSAIRFIAQSALTPDEARARVMIQAALQDFGAGYLIMARTALSAILQPSPEAVGKERAYAMRAIDDKFLDFGVFDRAGRCLIAIELNKTDPALGSKAVEKSIVRAAINQASVPLVSLTTADQPSDIHAKLAPYLQATARMASPATTTLQPKRAPRPGRPVRPVRPAAIAAE